MTVLEHYKQHGLAATYKKFPEVNSSTIHYWVQAAKKFKAPKEPTYKPVVIAEKKKPESKKIFVVYSEDPDAIIATLKGIL